MPPSRGQKRRSRGRHHQARQGDENYCSRRPSCRLHVETGASPKSVRGPTRISAAQVFAVTVNSVPAVCENHPESVGTNVFGGPMGISMTYTSAGRCWAR